MTKAEARVIRAALRESRAELAREGHSERVGKEQRRMMLLASYVSPTRAYRLRACAALLQERKEKRHE